MPTPDIFAFDDELIDQLRFEKDMDCCGAMTECREGTCVCALLGKNGWSISVGGDTERGWFARHHVSQGVCIYTSRDTLEEAVESSRADLLDLRPAWDESEAA